MKKRNYPSLWNLANLKRHMDEGPTTGLQDGTWVPARPLGWPSFWSRVRLAWRVFTGECDALKWPGGQ